MDNKHKDTIKRIFAMICALLIVIAFLASIIVPSLHAHAVSQKDLDKAKEKTEEAKNEMEKAEKEMNAAIAEYEAVERQIFDVEEEITIIENQIIQTQTDIEIKREELKIAEENFKRHEEVFMARARAMYENSDIKYLEILFGAESFSDFLSKIEMISQLMKYDQKILQDLKQARKDIEDAKKGLDETLIRLDENAAILQEKRDVLSETLLKKEEFMKKAENNHALYRKIYEAAEKQEKQMIEQYKEAMKRKANPIEYTGGTFAWPVPGSQRITSYYGYRIHPVYGTRKFHSGIDIGAAYGLDIVAAADGIVTMATTNGGYGKCIIINHGSGIASLYGHCSSLLVTNGQSVKKGDVIGKIGSTGVSTGPHLHFEVRVDAATTDPLQYLR